MSLEWAISHEHEYDITITHKLNQPSELSFKILTKGVHSYKIGEVIEYDDKIYIVDKIDIDREDYSITTVTCQQNAINLAKKINGKFEYIAETVQTLVKKVLEGSGWNLGKTDIPTNMKRHLISEETTVLANLNTIAENFGAVIIFNYDTVDILMQKGEELIINDNSNLTGINVSKDGGDIITRLHVFGGIDKDTGIETSILDRTNGLTYIEDYSFFLEQGFSLSYIQSRPDLFLREAVYRNTDIYNSEALYNAGVTQLQSQLYPEITCSVKIVDNGNPVRINMKANIYDSETGIHLNARVTEVSINKDEPKVINVVLSNAVSYGSWITDVVTKVDRIDNVVNDVSKSWQEILEEAKNNATDLINSGLKNSSVIVKKNCIIVGDNEKEENMKNCWLWTSGGLGHSKNGVGGQVDVAMTMDGAIVADRITAGEFNGAIIRAGSIKADALSVEAYEKFQQGINIGATNYIRNSGNFIDSTYWLGNVNYSQNLLICNGIVKNVTNIPIMGGNEYVYSATIITEEDMEITEDNLILGYTAYQPLGIPQSKSLSDDELADQIPIIITKSRTYEIMEGSDISIEFESGKTLKSLKLSINNGDDFNYEGIILDNKATFKLSHLTYGNYICKLMGEDENNKKGYTKTFILNVATSQKNSVIFSNIGIAKPYNVKANTLTRIFLKYKTRNDLKNGFIINPTINIDGNYKIKNVQWENGNMATDWKPNMLDITEGTLNEAKTMFQVESGKISGKIEEIEKKYVTTDKLNLSINNAKNDINKDLSNVNNKLEELERDIGDISLDGIIDGVELSFIREKINELNKEKLDVDTRFNNLYESVFLSESIRANLNQAKNSFDLKHTSLIDKINEIVEDNILDEDELNDFKLLIEQYQSALALLSKAFDDALSNISENASNTYTNKKTSEILQTIGSITATVEEVKEKIVSENGIEKRLEKAELSLSKENIIMTVTNSKEFLNSKKNLIAGGNFKEKNLDAWKNDRLYNITFYESGDNIGIRATDRNNEGRICSSYISAKALNTSMLSMAIKLRIEEAVNSCQIYLQEYNSSKKLLREILLEHIEPNFDGIKIKENFKINNDASYISFRIDHDGATKDIYNVIYLDYINVVEGQVAVTEFLKDDGKIESYFKIASDKIEAKVDNNGVRSIIEQSPTSVQVAFNNINENVQNSDGTFSIKNGKLELYNQRENKVFWVDTTGRLCTDNINVFGGERLGNIDIKGTGNKGIVIRSLNGGDRYIDFSTFNDDGSNWSQEITKGNFTRLWAMNGDFYIMPTDKLFISSCNSKFGGSKLDEVFIKSRKTTIEGNVEVDWLKAISGFSTPTLTTNNIYSGDGWLIFNSKTNFKNQIYCEDYLLTKKIGHGSTGGVLNKSEPITFYSPIELNNKNIGGVGTVSTTNLTANSAELNYAKINYLNGDINCNNKQLYNLKYINGDNLSGSKITCNEISGGSYFRILSSPDFNRNSINNVYRVSCTELAVSGTKNCVQDTENFGKRLINAYETCDYLFGDVGESVVENGECIVWIDDIFKEIISTDYEYQVFITKYGKGDIWVSERHSDYFVVQAENDISFGWEVKGKRKGYENCRLVEYKEESEIKQNE